MLFLASGASGLIYQTVWMRTLVRGFGVTVQATSTIVAVFLAGLALGAVLSGTWSRRVASGLKGYALAELAVGLLASLATVVLNQVPGWMAALGRSGVLEDGAAQLAVRLVCSSVILLPPTIAMGVTLPILVDTLRDESDGARVTARLYGFNTLGAVLGVLLTGFVLLAFLGETGTIAFAVAVNLVLGAIAWGLSSSAPSAALRGVGGSVARGAVAVACVCGLASIALEVVWTRLLVLLVGSSVYAFSLMLASFLIGTALGSLAYLRLSPRWSRHPLALSWFLQATAVLCLVTLQAFQALGRAAHSDRYLFSPLLAAQDLLTFAGTALVLIVPVTFMFGCLFPLCVEAAAPEGGGRVAGIVYAWNTVGAVLGSLLSGFVLIPLLSTQGVIVACAALLWLVGTARLLRANGSARALGACLVVGLLGAGLTPRENVTVAILRARLPGATIVRHTDDSGASVTILDPAVGGRSLLINGILTSEVSDVGGFMADLPLLLQDHPTQGLVICLGAGDAARCAVQHLKAIDANAQIEIVELQQHVVNAIPLFQKDGGATFRQPGVQIYVRDGRHHLLMSGKRYDYIIIDTTPPFFGSGAVNLYSQDFQRLARDHLTPTGIFMQWLPSFTFERDLWAVARGSAEIFPHQVFWTAPRWRGGMLLSSLAPIEFDDAQIARRCRERGFDKTRPWLAPPLIHSGWVNPNFVRAKIVTAPRVTDDFPVTEYPLGEFLRQSRLVEDFADLIPPEARWQTDSPKP